MAARKPYVRWLFAALTLLFFIVVLVILERVVTLTPGALWALRIGLILLGLIAAGAILWYLRPTDGTEPVLDMGDDVLATLNSARARLPRRNLTSLPLVLVAGPEGSVKTSLVARSGGDPELLAGSAPAQPGDLPSPTTSATVWAMQQSIVVELTSRLLTDATRWGKVLRALRAPRAAAAVGKGEAAPRSVLLCVPCDLFYEGSSGQQLSSLATLMRQRLAEASRELGLALPVYVVFTKMDRIPHFEQWVAPFSRDELRAPLGATLPFDATSDSGNYAERLTPRLNSAFQQIVNSLANRRVDVLGRDSVQERRYAAYELPARTAQADGPRHRVPRGPVPSHATRLQSPVARLLLRGCAACAGGRCRVDSHRRARSVARCCRRDVHLPLGGSPARGGTDRSVRRHTQDSRVGVSRSAAARCRAFRWRCGVSGEWRCARAAVPSCAAGRGDCCEPCCC